MAKRQKKKKQNITLDDLKQESQIHEKDSEDLNVVEKSKDKNVTLDDIVKDENLIIENDEGKFDNDKSEDLNVVEKSKDNNVTLDDIVKSENLIIENDGGKMDNNNSEDLNLVEKSKDKNVTLDDIANNEEGKIKNEEGEENSEETPVDIENETKKVEDEVKDEGEGENHLNTNEYKKLESYDESNNTSEESAMNTEPQELQNNNTEDKKIFGNNIGENNVSTSDINDNSQVLNNGNIGDNTTEPSNNTTEAEDNANTNSQNIDNDKGDIALDNLSDHINVEETNTINVNDEKYNVNVQNNSSENTDNNGGEGNTESSDNQGNIGQGDEDGLNLEEINISAGISDDAGLNLDLSGGSLYDIQKAPRIRTGKITVLSVLISIISVGIGVLAYFYNDFITHDLTNIEENRAYTFVETAKDFISRYKKGDTTDTVQSINLIGKNGEAELDNLINGNLNYIQKKEILDDAVAKLSNNIISKYAKLNDIRTDITRYGFFPKDLSNIISESEPISSIQNSLIALEAIKFSSAISVFSYLDTFTTSLVQSLGIDREEVEEKVGEVTSRGESDINIYIKNCYLNPFEGGYDCDYIGDFDEYYKNLNDNFDTEFFKELIKYTDSRLEQSEIPSFAISFKEFNQADNEITFDIEINTLKEDEAELTKKGILSPHIFILNSLINSLRQSRFIVGDDISVKTLNVMPNTYIIGMSEINVNRSVNTFTVHIKKENAVEIDDFVYMDY